MYVMILLELRKGDEDMGEIQINTKVPETLWEDFSKLVGKRIYEGNPVNTKKAILAEALRDICIKEGITTTQEAIK